ncbi:hypothetical protein [Paraburkholderia phymatum]|uniref:Uncharacterized protein n=1 Tax=Paraburkholderia phymatum (strain DSM 17167 / CIP 108236 / LMG 21445 / STM815) TaxID=391038 RepID=B2JX32_PARP8|nr:hypothetical protein [Paraburkholderia phymatum]ACC75509.1 hypothetical protein Bphy_6479 [Paraburkholderia phymatum STM815]
MRFAPPGLPRVPLRLMHAVLRIAYLTQYVPPHVEKRNTLTPGGRVAAFKYDRHGICDSPSYAWAGQWIRRSKDVTCIQRRGWIDPVACHR